MLWGCWTLLTSVPDLVRVLDVKDLFCCSCLSLVGCSVAVVDWFKHYGPTRWAPTSYKWGYNSYKWPYKWVTGVITLLIGVITPSITGRGPPCMDIIITLHDRIIKSCHLSMSYIYWELYPFMLPTWPGATNSFPCLFVLVFPHVHPKKRW